MPIPQFLSGAVTVRTIREGIETVEKIGQQGEPTVTITKRKRGGQPGNRNRAKGIAKTPTAAQDAPKPNGTGKRRGRPPKAQNGSYEALLASMRAEREKLIDKVAALGTAIEALEAL